MRIVVVILFISFFFSLKNVCEEVVYAASTNGIFVEHAQLSNGPRADLNFALILHLKPTMRIRVATWSDGAVRKRRLALAPRCSLRINSKICEKSACQGN